MNNRNPRTIVRVPKDEPGLGDDIPCSKCGSALDTGLECTECGHAACRTCDDAGIVKLGPGKTKVCPTCAAKRAAAPRAIPDGTVEWTDEQLVRAAADTLAEHQMDALFYETGPYDITVPTLNLRLFLKAMLAAAREDATYWRDAYNAGNKSSQELVEALKLLSPWKLQDCWCDEADHGGNKPHTEKCAYVREAIANVKRSTNG